VNGQTGLWFYAGGFPGVFATRISGAVAAPWGAGGYPAPNYTVYDLRDDSVQAGSTYEYVAKYRPETPSINTYQVTVNAANCGGAATPTPTPTSGPGDGRISGYCTWVGGSPRVNLSWSQNPPPGVTATVNALQKGDCHPNDPDNYWCFLNINSNQYSYTDTTVVADTQYQYRAKYTPGNTSINTFNIYTSAANCGAPPPRPVPLDISPDYQTLPPNVTALFTATGGDGSYSWSASGGAISGSGANIGVVFTNNSTSPITRTGTVTSGTQTATATVEVEGIATYQDDITVRGLGSRYVFVDDNEPVTSSSYTTLTLAHGFANDATSSITMQVGNTSEAALAVAAQPFQESIPWNLCEGLDTCEEGLYTVYTVYKRQNGEASPVVTDNIVYAVDEADGLARVTIESGAATTADRLVSLALVSGFVNTPSDEISMQIANSLAEVDTADPMFFSPTVLDWDLCAGSGSSCANGNKSVFVRFCYRGTCSTVVYDDIYLDSPWPDWGVRINDDAPSTGVSDVQLRLNPWFGKDGVQVLLSNTPDFSVLASATYADIIPWNLCAGLLTCTPENYTVYVRYIDGEGTLGWPTIQSPRYEDEIVLGATPTPTPTPLPAGVLIEDGTQTVTSRRVKLTLTSPFGAGAGVSMRPINEEALTLRDRELIAQMGGGINSQPSPPPSRDILPKPAQDTRQLPLSPSPTAPVGVPGVPTDAIQNRVSQVDADLIADIIPELESGTVRLYAPELEDWDLCAGRTQCPYGTYKVFIQYYHTPAVVTATAALAALGDEVSDVYFDTVEYVEPTPTPSIPVSPPVSPSLPPPTSSVPPPVGTPPPGDGSGGGVGDVIDAMGAAENTIGLVAMASSVAVLMSALVTLGPLLSSAGAGALTFAWQWFMGVIGLLPKRKKVWGTVYDANTKRPIPFAKVQLLDRNRRVLETRVADKDGRYGFLTTPESLMAENVQIQILPSAPEYVFPSKASPSVDTLVYNNLYFGDLITVSDKTLINFDVPMDPLKPSAAPLLLKSPSIALGAAVAAIADAGFWLGVIMVPMNFIISPNPFTLGVLFLFFGTASLRIWGISEHPFGVIKDKETGRPMAFALITLNDMTGARVAFTVTDEQGRYFLVVQKGMYELNAFTPATIQPGRQSKSTVDARKGWITREITL